MKHVLTIDIDAPAREPIGAMDSEPKTAQRLDALRSEFFIDLSHQLRTPITAMKLAMDGLFSQLHDVLSPSQQNLARISCKNVERIVSIVENQLDLLRIMAGDMPVSPRLVDIDALLRSLPKRSWTTDDGDAQRGSEATGMIVFTRSGGIGRGTAPLYAFTDPDHLAAIVECILGSGPPNSRRSILLDYDTEAGHCLIEVRIDFLDAPDSRQRESEALAPVSTPLDFELRAYRSLIAGLGGDVVFEKADDYKWARIRIPRYPL